MTRSLFPLLLILLPAACAPLAYGVFRRSPRAGVPFVMVATGAELLLSILVACAPETLAFHSGTFMGLGLHLVLSGFSRVYVPVAALLFFVAAVFSREYFSGHAKRLGRYFFFYLLTLCATVGVFLSADLLTCFLFFEVLSFTSYAFVAHEETAPALSAANTYLAVAVIGGLVALMGLFLLDRLTGTLTLSELPAAVARCTDTRTLYAAGGCLLFGFGAKAGMFPLHIWLPKAHPVAPAPASALLSGILTKAGVFGVLAISAALFYGNAAWGALLAALGAVTMLLGAVLALLSVDLKRTLACSSVSQIGFILVGVGMSTLLGHENGVAARGTLLHMCNHSLFKLVLFLAAGAVYQNLHKLNLNDIRGFGRRKPVLKIAFLCGALGIVGVPGFSGYISKTLLHEGILEYAHAVTAAGRSALIVRALEWTFLFSGGLTAAYMTKLYVALFIERHPEKQAAFDAKKAAVSPLSAAALLLPAAMLPAFGLLPHLTLDVVANVGTDLLRAAPLAHAVPYFAWANLSGALVTLLLGAAVYAFIVRKLLIKNGAYIDVLPARCDLENALYRPFLISFLPRVLGVFAHALSDLPDALILLTKRVLLPDAAIKSQAHYESGLGYRLGLLFDRRNLRRGVPDADALPNAKRFSRIQTTVRETGDKIRQSLSFALLMTCFGICFVLLYLLLYAR